MLDELKNLFPQNGIQAVTELLKVSQQVAGFLEAQLQDNEKVNAAIDHFKALIEGHKK